MIGRRTKINIGKISPELLERIKCVDDTLRSGSFDVIKVVKQRKLECSCQKEQNIELDIDGWKRLVVSSNELQSSLVIKFFRPGSLLRSMYYSTLWTDPLAHAYRMHKLVSDLGVNTAKPLCHGSVRDNGIIDYSFFVMEDLSSKISMTEYVKRFLKQNKSDAARTSFIPYFSKRLAMLHNAGIFNKDIKPGHIFIDRTDSNMWEDPAFSSEWYWVDLDSTEISRFLTYEQRVHNLYQVWRYFVYPLCPDQISSFLSKYLTDARGFTSNPNDLAKDVEIYTQERVERAKQHGNFKASEWR